MRASAWLHHCTSIIIMANRSSNGNSDLHMLRLVEIALPPGLMDHMARQFLHRMLWADTGDPHTVVWCWDTGDRSHKATVRWGKWRENKFIPYTFGVSVLLHIFNRCSSDCATKCLKCSIYV